MQHWNNQRLLHGRGEVMKVALALFILSLIAPGAVAQPISGFYVQGSAGLTLPSQQPLGLASGPPSASDPSAATTAGAAINNKAGATQSGSGGWGFGNGVRLEVEGVRASDGGGTSN